MSNESFLCSGHKDCTATLCPHRIVHNELPYYGEDVYGCHYPCPKNKHTCQPINGEWDG